MRASFSLTTRSKTLIVTSVASVVKEISKRQLKVCLDRASMNE